MQVAKVPRDLQFEVNPGKSVLTHDYSLTISKANTYL